ncbi:lysylphosphatidylglycerol synthase domain-containing protein [Azospirillum canadense]|uniref:lysylphosphatidylglycerol synthase domain-containing protein n=1 Tax=Azospirillum canadense TaxID=403962 RepID=UPI002226F584|nr:lysylphosphatidylglycerol synthase domain-containing protein [Azospirillum canadense]MCW2243955.1 putative membrane protein [Azospirillum canadense]
MLHGTPAATPNRADGGEGAASDVQGDVTRVATEESAAPAQAGEADARTLRRGLLNGTVLGVLALLAIVLLNRDDLSGIGRVLTDLPAALAISAAVHLPQIILTGLAWRVLINIEPRPSILAMTALRWYREAANALLPAGALVGQAATARLVARQGVPGSVAGATATVDLTMEAVSQLFVTLAGFGLLLTRDGGDGEGGLTGFAITGLGIAAAGVIAMVALQRRLPLRPLEALLNRLSRRWPALKPTWIEDFQQAVLRLHEDKKALGAAVLLHSAAWMLGAVEIAGVLALLGHPVSLTDALIIESLAQALRNAGFMLPGAIGVQEGAVLAVSALVGVPAAPALTTALVRRAREVLFGLPGLVAWRRSERLSAVKAAA